MKKKVVLLLSILFVMLLLVACGKERVEYHTVTFNSNGAEEFQSRAIADNDLIVEPRVPTRAGYFFLGWYNGDTKWNFKTDKVTDDMTLTANWSRIKYRVKFDSNGGSPVEDQMVESGNFSIKPADPTKENCRFLGWYNGDDEWIFNINYVTDYLTLTAKWEDYPTHTVQFDSDGGTEIDSQYVIYGNLVSVPTPPTRKDSKFVGWYDGDVLWNFNANTINSNLTLTAKWEEWQTYTVTFNSSGGSAIPTQYVPVGEKVIKPQKPEKDLMVNFNGWYLGGTEWNFDTPVISDMTLVAVWQNMHKITFVTDGQSSTYFYIDEGSPIPKQPDPTKENFRFIGWYNGDKKWDFDVDRSISDLTLTAKWEPIPTYAVIFDTADGTPKETQHVAEGSYVQDPGNPIRQGYRFDGWIYDNKTWNFNTDKVMSEITLVAKWVETATVTFDSNGGSFIDFATTDKGRTVPKPKDPTKTGYVFRGWLSPDGTQWDFDKINVTENITLTAKWLKACTVSFDTDGAGEMADIILGEGELIPRPADPYKSSKLQVEYWYIEKSEVVWDFEEMTITEDVHLKIKWQPYLPPVIIGGKN